MPKSWNEIVSEKRQKQQASIPKEWVLRDLPSEDTLNVLDMPKTSGLLSEEEIKITQTDVPELLKKLADGTWSAVLVATAFAKTAIIAHQVTNCLTEIFIDRALAKAAELDEYRAKTGSTVGPLHGLPISLKDQISLEGIDSTMGYVDWVGKPAQKNAFLVDILEASGAVLFVKTNIPQTLMWPETNNNVFGRTVNPHNRNLTSGGSSGGEGALIAMRGAAIGVGSDIGGSIRLPAACCGTYGFRPTSHRIPYLGCVNSLEGQDSIPSVLGPLCNSLEGIKLFYKAVMVKEPWKKDPMTTRKRWNDEEYNLCEHGGANGPLCFGIVWDNEIAKPDPPVLRGLEMVRDALEAAGHQVVAWKPYKHLELADLWSNIMAAGISEDVQAVTSLTGEPWLRTMSPTELETIQREYTSLSAYALWQLQKEKQRIREDYLDHWGRTVDSTKTGRPVDAIITPIAPTTATPHGNYKLGGYSSIWNVLDYPALAIPVTAVDAKLDVKQPRGSFHSDLDKLTYERYDPAVYANAPVVVQLVGQRMEDEAVIRMSEILDQALKDLRKRGSS